MEVLNFAATAAKTSERAVIGVPTRKLVVTIIAAAANDLLLSALTERISIEINSKSGEKLQSLPNITLASLGHFSQQGEGAIHVTKLADGKFQGEYTVTLTPLYGIKLSSELELELTLAGARPNFTYKVSAKPEPITGTLLYKFDQRVVNQGTTLSNLPATTIKALILPDSAELERIDVHYVNGTTSTLNRDEIKADNNDKNDAVMFVDREPALGVICTQAITAKNAGYLFLNLIDAQRVTLYTGGGVYTYTSVQEIER